MRAASLAALLALGACTSGGDSILEKMRPLITDYVLGSEPAPEAPPVTRAAINQVPFATIGVTSEGQPTAYVIPFADNGGYVVYRDQIRRSIVLFGGLLTGTHGMGYDLGAVRHQADDPIAVQTPLARWPGRIVRNYHFPLRGGARDYEITTTCDLVQVAAERIEIVELSFDTVRVAETCRSPRRVFTNTYWADPRTGFIWKSEQWIGPRQKPLTIEIVRPYQPRG